ncbi:putative AMP-dependent synthetase/ligase, AMP-binding enzyme domain, ANL domain-containing protein [Septoria linicola]|nr:putative AMP-dependent synthetase/ligase, AMP-binding enzyme domain, ANL domain-containing protein [Septoria linicola]
MPGIKPEKMNIVQLALSGDYDSTLPVLIDAEEPTRFVSKEKALRLIASLTGAFDEDTTVCLNIPNDVTYPLLMMAIWTSRCRWTGVNPSYKAFDLAHHFRISETKYVITCEEQLEKVEEAVTASGQEIQIIIFTDILDTRRSSEQTACGVHRGHRHDSVSTKHVYLRQLQRSRSTAQLTKAINKIDANSIAALASTSGTTGAPKMAARTHKSHVLESLSTADDHDAKPYAVRRLFCTPIFHSFSTGEMVINSLRFGQPTYYLKRYDEELFPKAVGDYKITETFAPPALILKLVENPKAHSQIQPLRNIYCGGAPLVPELRARLNAIYARNPNGPPRITQVYGMTEGGWFTTFKYSDPDTTNSVGRPIPGYEFRVVEQAGYKSFEGLTTGELLVRSPMLMSKYLGNPQATLDSYEDDDNGEVSDWLKTGDVGYVHPSTGKIYIIDRCKDLIKVNGWQVSPTELENALMTVSGVLDAGVVGAGTDTNEHPVAFVVRANSGVTQGLLKEKLREKLASYKVAALEVRFMESLPKSITGKILKVELRKLCG